MWINIIGIAILILVIFPFVRKKRSIHQAVLTGNHKRLTKLLANRNLVNSTDKEGRTPLHLAAREVDIQAIRILLENDANVTAKDHTGFTALHYTGFAKLNNKDNSQEIIELLISKGADVNNRDQLGITPLHAASLCGSLKDVIALIKHGADINTKSNEGETPLHWALDVEHIEIAVYLIKQGASVDIQDNLGRTPLDVAKDNDILDTLKALI